MHYNSFGQEPIGDGVTEFQNQSLELASVKKIEAQMIAAKRWPRDYYRCQTRVMKTCERISLAQRAIYSYERSGETVTGPSIRLAEALVQAWENVDWGSEIIRTYERDGVAYSLVQSFAWDLELNIRQHRTFEVAHRRKARGKLVTITDPRDIYEHVANYSSRRVRACVLGILPFDFIEDAVDKCKQTIARGDNEPIEQRKRVLVQAFQKLGVSQEMIEGRLGHKVDLITADEIVDLRGIYQTLVDGVGKPSDYFDLGDQEEVIDAVGVTSLARKLDQIGSANKSRS